jgi:hypothetical protein
MKRPEMYKVMQHNIRKPILDDDGMARGEYHLLVENQNFGECYKENCAAKGWWRNDQARINNVTTFRFRNKSTKNKTKNKRFL